MAKRVEAAPAVESVAVARADEQYYTVTLACPTPLAHNPMTVQAESAEAAWDAFMRANGISGSDHERIIEPAKQ